jgi:hypothetical protein
MQISVIVIVVIIITGYAQSEIDYWFPTMPHSITPHIK